jgi:hypothetical protein
MIRIASTMILALLTACAGPDEESAACAFEESAPDRVPTNIPPDWESVISVTDANTLGKAVDDETITDDEGYRERIQAWDCLDLSWWSPAAPRKVVQIWADETECQLYERSVVELYNCDSHDGVDDIYRDQDADGFYFSEGDCNDLDQAVFPDSLEVCDGKDNNCDGRADEDLDCEDIEALDGGM